MDKQEALRIIRMIAEGDDPYEESPSAYIIPEHDPRTFKAICTVLSSIFPADNKKDGIFSFQPLILNDFLKSLVKDFINRLEKDAIVEALKKNIFKKSRAAEILGITYSELSIKIKNHNIEDIIKESEIDAIVEALTKTNYKEDEAAELLEINYNKLLNKIKEYNVGQFLLLYAIETDYRNQLNGMSLDEDIEIIEKNAILNALEKEDFKQEAALLLGCSFRTLRYRIDKLGIDSGIMTFSENTTVKPNYFKHGWGKISLDEFLKVIEKKVIEMALEETKNQKMKAAEKLGISFRTLRYRIEKLEIE